MSKTFRDRFHVDLVLCEDCGIGIPEFSPGQPGDSALFHQAVIRFDIKTAVMALPVFMAADVAQIQELWIRSFAFFVALPFQEDLIQDKISQYYCPFAVFCFSDCSSLILLYHISLSESYWITWLIRYCFLRLQFGQCLIDQLQLCAGILINIIINGEGLFDIIFQFFHLIF